MVNKLSDELLELSNEVKEFSKLKVVGKLDNPIELSSDVELPYYFKAEALHPGTFKGITLEEEEIILGKDTIFRQDDNFANNEINKDHKGNRKFDSGVDDLVGKVVASNYNFDKKALIMEGEIYDKSIALKIMNGLIKYVSLRINPNRIDEINGKRIAKGLVFEELSLVRAPGDSDAHIIRK